MTKILTILFSLLIVHAFAQAPQGIPYQAVARNSSGAVLASTAISVRFTIRDSVASGAIKYRETFSVTTSTQGIFSVNVGQGTPVTGTFAGINWGTNAKFLQVELDPAGGSSYVDMGTQQMMSVPYSIYSNNGMPAVTAVGDILYSNGTNWVKLPAGADGQILTMSGGVPVWAALSGSGSSGGSGGGGIPSYLPTTGLVAWYPFTGNANDSSGNGHNGTNYGATLTTDRNGNTNRAYSFDGVSNYMSVPNIAQSGNSARSFVCWVQITDSSNEQCIISSGYPSPYNTFNLVYNYHSSVGVTYNVGLGVMGFVPGDYYPITGTTGMAISNGQWHQAVVTYDGAGALKLYVDGILNNSTIGMTYTTTAQNNFFGKSNHVGAEGYYDGKLDDIAIYNRALTATEITQIYNGSVASTITVGSSYGGGKVAYIFAPGDPGYVPGEVHGLIAAPSDQSTGIQWGCYGTVVGGTYTALGTGAANTAIVSAACGAGTAARLCADLVLNGYSDWYLPSRDELNKLYINIIYIGGFTTGYYWSSSESFAYAAWGVGFYDGFTGDDAKATPRCVRAVRSF